VSTTLQPAGEAIEAAQVVVDRVALLVAEIESLRKALQAMVDCSHTMDVHCCARASQLAASALAASAISKEIGA